MGYAVRALVAALGIALGWLAVQVFMPHSSRAAIDAPLSSVSYLGEPYDCTLTMRQTALGQLITAPLQADHRLKVQWGPPGRFGLSAVYMERGRGEVSVCPAARANLEAALSAERGHPAGLTSVAVTGGRITRQGTVRLALVVLASQPPSVRATVARVQCRSWEGYVAIHRLQHCFVGTDAHLLIGGKLPRGACVGEQVRLTLRLETRSVYVLVPYMLSGA
jgi:hypothetical protein